MIDVPAADQRTQDKVHRSQFAGGGRVVKSVTDDDARGGSVENEGAQQGDFLFAFTGKTEGEGYMIVIAGDILEKTPALGIDHAGVNAAGKRNDPAVYRDGVLKGGEEHISPRRSLYGQQSMIAAGVASLHGAGGVVPQTVGKEPFPAHVAGRV